MFPDSISTYLPYDGKDAALVEWIKLKTPLVLEKLKNLPTEVILSPLPPVVNQGQLGSSAVCGVHAGTSQFAGSLRVAGNLISFKSRGKESISPYYLDTEAKIDWEKAEKWLDPAKKQASVEDAVSDS